MKITSFKISLLLIGLGFVASISSCKDCYTCQAYILENRVDFDESCGTQSEKDSMEMEFRRQYPDSAYMVTCN